jgi:hypothetical protein
MVDVEGCRGEVVVVGTWIEDEEEVEILSLY